MADPFVDAIAAALAGQAVAALSGAGKAALTKIRELVRRKSEHDSGVRDALEAAEQESAEQHQVTALAERLDQASTDDPDFAEQLRSLGTPVHKEISGNAVVNEFSGTADKVIQARDVHGGITLN